MSKKIMRSRKDRWADWAVVGVLVLALLLGTSVMAVAEGQTVKAANAEAGLTVRYPKGWLLKPAESLSFQAVDPSAGDFKTTYQVQSMPVGASEPTTPTLTLALNNLSLSRAQRETAHRLFEVAEGPPLDGRPTMEAGYAYVVKGNDLFTQRMPVVVQGVDIAVAQDGRIVVFTLLASQDAFASAEKDFRRFVELAELG
jgi:hypothetical protein